MEDQYYTKRGFKGLTILSKLIFTAIFLAVAFLVWQISGKGNVEQARQARENIFRSQIIAAGKMIIAGLICGYAAQFLLPKIKCESKKFYCADCGQFLGYQITRCANQVCLSNRYTTDADMAAKAKLKSQNKT